MRFDADGTLVDSSYLHDRANEEHGDRYRETMSLLRRFDGAAGRRAVARRSGGRPGRGGCRLSQPAELLACLEVSTLASVLSK